MIRLTVEETNLLSIYNEGGKRALIENVNAALPYMDADMRELAKRTLSKVDALPADRLLYAELYQTGDKKKCTECGAFFASTSNSVKYCPVCRKRITRRQAAERMRKRRTPVTQ